MKTIILKYDATNTYPEYLLIVEINNYGDQVISLKRERTDGSFHYPFCETNEKNLHKDINKEYISNLINKYCKE